MTQKAATKYKKAKIYKIVNTINNECFIGGTCEDLNKKFNNYKILVNDWLIKTNNQNSENSYNLFRLRTTCNVVLYDSMFNKYGLNNCKIVLLENYSCDNLLELKLRVKYYTDTYDCLNTSHIQENTDIESNIDLYSNTDTHETSWSDIYLNEMDQYGKNKIKL